MLWVILWIGLAIAAGAIARSKGRSFFGYLILTLLLPLIGLIIAAFIAPIHAASAQRRDEIKCPRCAEMVLREAKACKHCGGALPAALGRV